MHDDSAAPEQDAIKPTLTSLPTEIKIRIARMCRDQDHAARDTFNEAANRFDTETSRGVSAYDDGDEAPSRYISTVGSLFCLSREWHAIAARIRFRRLHLSHLVDPVFPYAIGPRYGHVVHEIYLDMYDDTGSLRNLMSALPYLSNLKEARLPSVDELARRMGDEVGCDWTNALQLPAEAAFARVIGIAQQVEIPASAYYDTLKLCRGANLRSLRVGVPPLARRDQLMFALAACPALTELRIKFEARASMPFFLNKNFQQSKASPPPSTIRRLTILAYGARPELFDFIGLFSPSLTTLRIMFLSEGGNGDASSRGSGGFPPSTTFPQLEELELNGCDKHISSCLASATINVMPALKTFLYDSWDYYDKLVLQYLRDPGLHAFAKARSHIFPPVDIRIHMEQLDNPGIYTGWVPADAEIPFRRRITYGESWPRNLRFVHPDYTRTAASDHPDCQTTSLRDKVEERLQWTRRLADQAKVTGDGVQLMRILEALQECEWLQVENMS
ncbi:hypothetical protein JCM8115_001221 [Rhodotorula mucilaginosa]